MEFGFVSQIWTDKSVNKKDPVLVNLIPFPLPPTTPLTCLLPVSYPSLTLTILSLTLRKFVFFYRYSDESHSESPSKSFSDRFVNISDLVCERLYNKKCVIKKLVMSCNCVCCKYWKHDSTIQIDTYIIPNCLILASLISCNLFQTCRNENIATCHIFSS